MYWKEAEIFGNLQFNVSWKATTKNKILLKVSHAQPYHLLLFEWWKIYLVGHLFSTYAQRRERASKSVLYKNKVERIGTPKNIRRKVLFTCIL